jgi:abortive infection bacteriophage resistance protein
MKYSKPPLDISAQLSRLISIGLHIPDIPGAERALRFIGYFRLKGYFLPFMSQPNPGAPRRFAIGTSFDQILDLYQFDRQLRVLFIDEIERLEVAIRVVICNELSLAYGAHWYITDHQKIFNRKFDIHKFWSAVLNETTRSKDTFVVHYFKTYDEPLLPPSWVMAECLTISHWYRVYDALAVQKNAIARHFNLTAEVFCSWLHVIWLLRNVCAHHGRLWNRHHSIRPMVLKTHAKQFSDPSSFYSRAAIVRLMTQAVDSKSDFPSRLKSLAKTRTPLQLTQMAFPANWETDSFWN